MHTWESRIKFSIGSELLLIFITVKCYFAVHCNFPVVQSWRVGLNGFAEWFMRIMQWTDRECLVGLQSPGGVQDWWSRKRRIGIRFQFGISIGTAFNYFHYIYGLEWFPVFASLFTTLPLCVLSRRNIRTRVLLPRHCQDNKSIVEGNWPVKATKVNGGHA